MESLTATPGARERHRPGPVCHSFFLQTTDNFVMESLSTIVLKEPLLITEFALPRTPENLRISGGIVSGIRNPSYAVLFSGQTRPIHLPINPQSTKSPGRNTWLPRYCKNSPLATASV